MSIWNQTMANKFIPEHMHGGLQRWIEHGIEPGSFLTAVLMNDLKEAVACADHINKEALPGYVMYLYNYAPRGCWGSVENFKLWADWFRRKREHDCDPTNAECDEFGCAKESK